MEIIKKMMPKATLIDFHQMRQFPQACLLPKLSFFWSFFFLCDPYEPTSRLASTVSRRTSTVNRLASMAAGLVSIVAGLAPVVAGLAPVVTGLASTVTLLALTVNRLDSIDNGVAAHTKRLVRR